MFGEFLSTFRKHSVPLANTWLKSFLKSRKQYVNLLGHFSIINTVAFLVPQGSALGLLLFLRCIIDLKCAFSKSVVHHFANDTNFLFPGKKLGTTESVINHELNGCELINYL